MRYYHTLCATTALSVIAFSAFAAPVGGVVSAGSATIAQGPGLTTITQGTDRAAIDWQSFNVGTNERVTFNQPSAAAITLNRIHDQNPSTILGSIAANGQVILANPNGMIFGKGSKVDVGGLVASTAGISNDAFMKGGLLSFSKPGNPNASIVANGTISIKEGGLAAFVAPSVQNNGWVEAPLGKIQLAGAETFTADLYGDGLISVAVSDQVKNTLVENSGTLVARAGSIVLTAAQAESLVSSAVNISGVVDASASLVDNNGIVTFGDGVGGSIESTAKQMTVASTSTINASGPKGGGKIKLGGDWQGKKLPSGKNAATSTVKKGAIIKANATHAGDGGTVVVWSDDTTIFDGSITATGGDFGGNGGHVETSGKIHLGLTGNADASSPLGTPGEWLLDPRNVVIQNNAVAGVENNVPGTGGTVDAPSDTYRVSAESIGVALSAGNNVTITTGTTGAAQTGTLTIGTADITSTSATDVTLTLKADNYINSTGTNTITATGSGKLHTIFWGDAGLHDMTAGGGVSLVNTNVTTNGGDFYIGGGADDGVDITDTDGNVLNNGVAGDGRPDHFAVGNSTLVTGVRINNSDITTGAGNVTMLGQGAATAAGNLHGISMLSGSAVQSTSGNMKLIGFGGTGTTTNRGVSLDGAGTELATTSGAITMYGKGGTSSNSGDRGVVITTGAKVRSGGTGAVGDITITGIGGNDLGTQSGIVLTGTNSEISTVDADIAMNGTGGTGTAGGGLVGIILAQAAKITSTGTGASAGKISLIGHAGTGTTGANHGVSISNQNTAITSVDGNIYIEGHGGDAPNTSANYGVILNNQAIVESTGTTANAAKIEMKGYGGTGTNSAVGLRIEDYSIIRSGYGNIDLEGTGGTGTEDRARGILINLYAGVESTGTGATAANISVDGTGGNSTDSDHGVVLAVGGYIRSVDGDIDITGRGGTGSGTQNYGLYLLSDAATTSDAPADITATGDGNITINATSNGIAPAFASTGDLVNSISNIAGTGNITINTNTLTAPSLAVRTTGTLHIAPTTASIDIGVADTPGTLQITNRLLDNIDAGNLIIGRSDGTGNISIGTHYWDDPVEFRTAGGLITLFGPQIGLAGTDASITFSGNVRTYYAIDFTGTTGSGVIFNGTREERESTTNGGGLYVPPPVITPPAQNPLPGNGPLPSRPGSGFQFPIFYSTDRALITLIQTQDLASTTQVAQIPAFSEFIFDKDRFDLSYLYSFSHELEDELN